jgi:hypothetical protein
MHSYEPRNIQYLRLQTYGDWRIKLYSIAWGQPVIDEGRFAAGLDLALSSLPVPARTESRPGVGFCILHQGRGADYVVLAWWDRENELPLRIFVKLPDEMQWRPARGSESVCVWDLEVIGFERNAYVATVLGKPAQPVRAYLDATFVLPYLVRDVTPHPAT